MKKKKTLKKFSRYSDLEVADSGWSIQFKTAEEDEGGDGKYFYLWIGNQGWKEDETF